MPWRCNGIGARLRQVRAEGLMMTAQTLKCKKVLVEQPWCAFVIDIIKLALFPH